MNIRGGKKQRPVLRVKAVKVIRYAVVDKHDQVVGNRLYHVEADAETFLHYLLKGHRGTQRKPQQITGHSSMACEPLANTDTLSMSVGMWPGNQGNEQRRKPTFTPTAMSGEPPNRPTPQNNPIDGHVNKVTDWLQHQDSDTLVGLLQGETTTPWEKDIIRGILGITPDQCPKCQHAKHEHSRVGCHHIVEGADGHHFCECTETHS